VDQAFLKKRPHFISSSLEYEQTHLGSTSMMKQAILDMKEGTGRVVFDANYAPFQSLEPRGKGHFFNSIDQDSSSKYYDKLQPYYNLKSNSDTTLIFESRFESGNLLRAT
jgi:hypothetical protein